ncbi:MAG: hypothetical protein L0H73_02350 [Nitrococcus sp.]|nr:hypothetical protein [Nitrococcus sp.]
MGQDEIIRELRAIREDLAIRHNYDMRALFDEAKRRERDGDRKVVHLEPKQIKNVTKQSA